MKLQNKWFIGAMMGAVISLVSTSCVDEIKFGNSFLELDAVHYFMCSLQ